MTPASPINPGMGAESGSTVFAFNPAMEGKPLDPSLRAQAEAMAPQGPAPETVVFPQPETSGVKIPVISEDATPAPEVEIPAGESDESLEEALKSSESGVEAPVELVAQEAELQPEPAVAEVAPEVSIPEPEIAAEEEPEVSEPEIVAEEAEPLDLDEKIAEVGDLENKRNEAIMDILDTVRDEKKKIQQRKLERAEAHHAELLAYKKQNEQDESAIERFDKMEKELLKKFGLKEEDLKQAA